MLISIYANLANDKRVADRATSTSATSPLDAEVLAARRARKSLAAILQPDRSGTVPPPSMVLRNMFGTMLGEWRDIEYIGRDAVIREAPMMRQPAGGKSESHSFTGGGSCKGSTDSGWSSKRGTRRPTPLARVSMRCAPYSPDSSRHTPSHSRATDQLVSPKASHIPHRWHAAVLRGLVSFRAQGFDRGLKRQTRGCCPRGAGALDDVPAVRRRRER